MPTARPRSSSVSRHSLIQEKRWRRRWCCWRSWIGCDGRHPHWRGLGGGRHWRAWRRRHRRDHWKTNSPWRSARGLGRRHCRLSRTRPWWRARHWCDWRRHSGRSRGWRLGWCGHPWRRRRGGWRRGRCHIGRYIGIEFRCIWRWRQRLGVNWRSWRVRRRCSGSRIGGARPEYY